jgi:hypothetical protein
MIWSRAGSAPLASPVSRIDGAHLRSHPVVPWFHAIIGRRPAGASRPTSTIALAIAGVWSSRVVV